MVTTAARGDGDLPPPGLFCPCCRGNELQLLGDHGRAEPACVGCGLFVRLLRHHGDPPPSYEPLPPGASEYAFDAPPAGSWWLGLIRHRDETWRAVTLGPDLGRCWDSLLTYPGRGDFLLVPTDPPRVPQGE
jgi:hypothetical protein